jgi:putative glutamine amidotransferase
LLDDLSAEALVERVDGLILTGGADINPARYGHAPHAALGQVSDERDRWELALIHAARSRSRPVLAICRGVQVLNVALGGTLIQDLPSERPGEINHDPESPRTARTHSVEIAPESRLGRAMGTTNARVNSIHHQAIERVADELRIVGTAPDGVIEGVEPAADSAWWCLGVQWHPEELTATGEPGGRDVFAALRSAIGER